MREVENLHKALDNLLQSQENMLREFGYTDKSALFVDYNHYNFNDKLDYLSRLTESYGIEVRIKRMLHDIKYVTCKLGSDSTIIDVKQRKLYAYFDNYDELNKRLKWCKLKSLPQDSFLITLTLQEILQHDLSKYKLKDLMKIVIKSKIKNKDYVIGYAAIEQANELCSGVEEEEKEL